MPICTNPKCGQITKTMSLYCPSCGQQTLSMVDRGQVDGPHSSEISMGNFDRITSDIPARKEGLYYQSKTKKSQRGSSTRKKVDRTPNWSAQPRESAALSVVSIIIGMIGLMIGLGNLALIYDGTYLEVYDSEIPRLLVLNIASTSLAVAAFSQRQQYWRTAMTITFLALLSFVGNVQDFNLNDY